MDYYQFRAMNCDIVLAAEGQPDMIARGFDRTHAFIDASEARFTRFAETSELSQLNRSAGSWFQASPELFEVMQQACAYASETNGLFDPTILIALEFAGYDKSMDEIRAQGVTMNNRSTVYVRSDFRAIELDKATHAIRLPGGTRIDLGGIAKGWIAEQAASILAMYATAGAVNAGGDLFAVGLPSDEPAWMIGLEDPRDVNQTLAVLNVGPGAVATSSIMKRRWQQGDRPQHHLIDPRRGAPAETDWLSVTVVAPHATTAEVYAKALLIAGSREATRIGDRRDDLIFIAVDAAGQLCGSAKSEEILNVHFQPA